MSSRDAAERTDPPVAQKPNRAPYPVWEGVPALSSVRRDGSWGGFFVT